MILAGLHVFLFYPTSSTKSIVSVISFTVIPHVEYLSTHRRMTVTGRGTRRRLLGEGERGGSCGLRHEHRDQRAACCWSTILLALDPPRDTLYPPTFLAPSFDWLLGAAAAACLLPPSACLLPVAPPETNRVSQGPVLRKQQKKQAGQRARYPNRAGR